jgi:deoxycytidine triphosphate deaminase
MTDAQASTEDKRVRRDPESKVWNNWQGAVLLRDEIERYCKLQPPLIDPFDPDQLKPASYYLRLGAECHVSGKRYELSAKKPRLLIPPHELAMVSTFEKLNVPGFLIGRWNLRVMMVYEGLIWVGGAQVDPGYEGHLYCPLYNLSTRAVELQFKESIFAIDFVRTTRFQEGISELWKRKRADSLDAHDIHLLESAVAKDLRRIDEIDSRTKQSERTLLPTLAIVVAIVAIIAGLGLFGRFKGADCLSWTSIGVSGLAVVLAALALFFSKSKSR